MQHNTVIDVIFKEMSSSTEDLISDNISDIFQFELSVYEISACSHAQSVSAASLYSNTIVSLTAAMHCESVEKHIAASIETLTEKAEELTA